MKEKQAKRKENTSGRKTIVALVPMRHHSERVQGKNYRNMAGRPLFAYILDELLEIPEISQIVVDTDSPIIMEGIDDLYPTVSLIERPIHLRGDAVSMNQILLHDVGQIPADYYLQTHCTNPLLKKETIRQAIGSFLESYPQHDSLFSVTKYQTRLWDMNGHPVNHDPDELLRTQDLPPLFEENSCLYIFERKTFLERGNRLGSSPKLFEIEKIEALDIDNEIDFIMAECLIEWRNRSNLAI
jgi:CMP-N-acetylneuraminic acid synthetase